MHFYCTTCCKEKNASKKLMPAIRRYLDPRILNIYERSISDGRKFVILSGKYGFIEAETPIPWYDKKLEMEDVDELVSTLSPQIKELGVTNLTFFGLDRKENPDWEPYYKAVEKACAKKCVGLSFERYVSFPHIYSLIGDFGAGKTTTVSMLKAKTDFWIGEEFFDFLSISDMNMLRSKLQGTPLVIKLNEMRDAIIVKANPHIAILDQDAMTLAGYEFAKIVHNQPSQYKEVVESIRKNRIKYPKAEPGAYIILNVDTKTRQQRLKERAEKGRKTEDFISSELTHVAFKSFYQCILENMESSHYMYLNTTNKNEQEVFDKVLVFINNFEKRYKTPERIWDMIASLSVETILLRTNENLKKEEYDWS